MAQVAISHHRPSSEADVAATPIEELHSINWVMSVPYIGVHVAAIVGPFLVGISWQNVALLVALFYSRMFFVTGAYHRYFSHRTYRTSRAFQFFLAVCAMTSVQKGVLWWAGHHRHHHKHSDTEVDIHSYRQRGFWWSHQNWILANKYNKTDSSKIPDLIKFPELVWLDKFHVVPGVVLAFVLFLTGGAPALIWGFFVSTTLLWHATFTINSLSHLYGSRQFDTSDDSRNNPWLALLTLGEGWHNNHHFYQRATNQGFYWWELDITYYVLKALSWTGLIWDLHKPPKALLARARIRK